MIVLASIPGCVRVRLGALGTDLIEGFLMQRLLGRHPNPFISQPGPEPCPPGMGMGKSTTL